ncbi:MAG TPA: ribosome biogenesis GTP-binding protein YihA/YsxC [Polyangiaceae bacterium]
MSSGTAPIVVSAEYAASAARPVELPPPVAVEIAFAGRSNVGKSTLLNALMHRRGLARTSSTPGCTRTVNFFRVRTRDGATLTLVDLPGYGYAKRARTERESWAEVAETYLLERQALRLVVLLVDARRGLEDDDRDLLEMVETSERRDRPTPKTLVVATKLDRLSASARKPTLARVAAGRTVVGTAESDPKSIDALWRELRRLADLPSET